jgi:hypothetical protein
MLQQRIKFNDFKDSFYEDLERVFDTVRFEVFTEVTMKNAVFRDVMPLALVRTDVLEELSASIIRVTRIGELGISLAITSNRCTLQRNTSEKALRRNIPEDGILMCLINP